MSNFTRTALHMLYFICMGCAALAPQTDTDGKSIPKHEPSSSSLKEDSEQSGLMKVFGGRFQIGKNELLVTIDVPFQLSQNSIYNQSQEELKKRQLLYLDKLVEECRIKISHNDKIIVGRLVLVFRTDNSGIATGLKSATKTGVHNNKNGDFKIFSDCVEAALIKNYKNE